MDLRRVLGVFVVSSVATLVGCGGGADATAPSDPLPPPPANDSGAPAEDTGAASDDTGAPIEDTAVASEDTGAPVEDTGAPVEDTGAPAEDTGAPAVDAGPPPAVSKVAITAPVGYSDNQVRQGLGAIKLTVTGSNLAEANAATLSGTGVACAIESKSDASVVLACDVTHGASLGGRALTIKTAAGESSFGGALDVTKITANATITTGDTSGVGTTSRPFRTLTKAASVSGNGDVVFVRTLGDGSLQQSKQYYYGIGELFPVTIPDGVTIEGEGSGLTRTWLAAAGSGLALKFAASGTVKNFNIASFATAVEASAGTVVVEDVDMRGSQNVLRAIGSVNMTVRSATGADPVEGTRPTCAIENTSGALAKYLVESSTSGKLTFVGCLVTGSTSSGVFKSGTGGLELIRTDLYNNGTTKDHYGLYATGSGLVKIQNGDIKRNFGAGIVATDSVSMILQSTHVRENGKGVGRTTLAGYAPVLGNAGIAYWSTGNLTLERDPGVFEPWGTWIADNGFGGVSVFTGAGPTTQKISLDGAAILSNDGALEELFVQFAGSLTVKKSIIKSSSTTEKNYGAVGIAGTPALVDLGKAAAPADNIFMSEGIGASAVVIDRRPAVATACSSTVAPTCNPVYVCGSTLNGSAPAASLVSGPVVGPLAANVPSYEIKYTNRRIGFCQ